MLWGASPALSQPNPLLSSQDTGSAVSAAPEGVHEAMPDVSETPAPVVSEAVPKGAAADAPYRVFVRNLSILNGLWQENASYVGDAESRSALAGALGLEYLDGTADTVRVSGDLSGIASVLSSEDRDIVEIQKVLRRNVGEGARYSGGDGQYWEFADALFDMEIDQRARLALYSGLLPDLIQIARVSGDDVRARKFRMQRDTFAYHLGKLSLGVSCAWAGSDVSFVFVPEDIGKSGTFEASVVLSSDQASEEAVSCGVTVRETASFADASLVEDALEASLQSLRAKDSDAVSEDLLRLTRSFEGLLGRYGMPSVLNRYWEGAPLARWQSELDVIRLMLVEQTRFATADRVERVAQRIWPGASFYARLYRFGETRKSLDGAFGVEAARLWEANGASYRWVADHMDPKKIKKLDKAFAAWTKTKSAKKDAMLPRRLLGAWAMWSLGDYARAASYAGNVAEGKSRLVHPQLHSFDVMLKAVRGEEISEEALGTYIRVISLKVPSLAYETLSASGRWFKPSMRMRIASLMREQDPAQSPSAAAEFYSVYASELRKSWDRAHSLRVDAWLEMVQRPTESALRANRRRLVYLADLVDAGDVAGVSLLARRALRERESMLPQWAAFWAHVQAQAASGELGSFRSCVNDARKLMLLEVSGVNACFEDAASRRMK